MKKVSIIVPLYNASRYIEKCLDSCIMQDYPNCEIIVVNDGSTDDSVERIKPYLDKIRYIYQENMGGSAARNAGLDEARGTYVFFLDSDDIIFPDTITKLVTSIEEDGSDLCLGAYETMDAAGRRGDIISFRNKDCVFSKEELPILFTIYPNPSTKLFRMNIIKENGLRFENLRIAQDLNFFFRYLICCSKASYINTALYIYRVTAGSISTSYDDRILDIIKAFDGVESFAKARSFPLDDIKNVKYAHSFFQMTKTRYVGDIEMRKRIFYGLAKGLRNISISREAITYEYVRDIIIKSKIVLLFGCIYTSRLVHLFYRSRGK